MYSIEYMRVPEDGDVSLLKDNVNTAFQGTVSWMDLMNKRICTERAEHMNMLPRPVDATLSNNCLESLCVLVTTRGSLFASFLHAVLRNFEVQLDSSSSTDFAALLPAPAEVNLSCPRHGVLYFSSLASEFQKYQRLHASKSEKNSGVVTSRRSLWASLSLGLSLFGIHGEKDSRTGALYFFSIQLEGLRIESLKQDARSLSPNRDTVIPSHAPLSQNHSETPPCIPVMHSDFERSVLLGLAKFYKDRRDSFLNAFKNVPLDIYLS